MFTGIINHRGTVVETTPTTLTLSISPTLAKNLKNGSSIAINGVCLTVTNLQPNTFQVDVMHETLKKTTLGALGKGDTVNLELPMSVGGRLEGHIVQGHVDGVAKVVSIKIDRNSHIISFQADKELTHFMVPKGSITLDGISLTLISVESNEFSVGIIPYTFTNTNVETYRVGTPVNVEVDIIAKYVERLLKFQQRGFYEKH